jgi:hypothetical protein
VNYATIAGLSFDLTISLGYIERFIANAHADGDPAEHPAEILTEFK